jgi:TonB family protein
MNTALFLILGIICAPFFAGCMNLRYEHQATRLIVFADSSLVSDLSEFDIPFDPDSSEDFFFPEREPYIDIKELQRNVQYPIMAKMLGWQGKVNICVLVGKSGFPVKAAVQSSDYKIFEKPALDAVMRLCFQPAILNKQPIACKVSLPIQFRLR